jgi:Rrf2 family cysteine metabolism transcriptional repressor
MRITARVEYATLALFDLALNASARRVQTRDIAERQQIPLRFLEQILAQLKRAGLVRSVRGASGGYLLAKPASAVSLKDIVEAVEGELTLLDDRLLGTSPASQAWKSIEQDLLDRLTSTTIRDLVEKKLREDAVLLYEI